MAPPTSWRGSLSPAEYPDRPMVIRYCALAGTMTYRSFHAAATRTFSEGERRLRRAPYKEPPEGIFLGSGTGQKCVSSPVADEVARPPANGRKAEAPLTAVETRRCEACDADFRPARPWSGARLSMRGPSARCQGLSKPQPSPE